MSTQIMHPYIEAELERQRVRQLKRYQAAYAALDENGHHFAEDTLRLLKTTVAGEIRAHGGGE